MQYNHSSTRIVFPRAAIRMFISIDISLKVIKVENSLFTRIFSFKIVKFGCSKHNTTLLYPNIL